MDDHHASQLLPVAKTGEPITITDVEYRKTYEAGGSELVTTTVNFDRTTFRLRPQLGLNEQCGECYVEQRRY